MNNLTVNFPFSRARLLAFFVSLLFFIVFSASMEPRLFWRRGEQASGILPSPCRKNA
jgi:hypothetical protein